MSDGPFRNFALGKRWKRFATAAHNPVVGPAERCALACDALANDLVTDANRALLDDLNALVLRPQLEFESMNSVDNTFDRHSKTPFADALQRDLAPRISDRIPLSSALDYAARDAVHDQTDRARSRIKEECLRSRASGEMTQDQYDRTVAQANAAFDALPESDVLDALRAGDKNAFQCSAAKKSGLDDGPSL